MSSDKLVQQKKSKRFSKFQAALRSIKFTVILITCLAVLCSISTFVRQGLHEQDYYELYPKTVADLILSTDFNTFFTSWWFLVPAALFFLNLSACTIFRFSRELKKPTDRNFGPDILHAGLILLIIASVLSVFYRQDAVIRLSEGDSIKLPGGGELFLEKFEYLHHENGRPIDWISHISVFEDGQSILQSYPLRVNHPIKLNGITFYQYSYLTMNGKQYTVLQAVSDPAYILVLAAFIICCIGLCVTMWIKIQKKLREKHE